MKQSKHTLAWLNAVTGSSRLHIALLTLIEIAQGLFSVAFALYLRQLVNAAAAGQRRAFFLSLVLLAGLCAFQLGFRAVSRHLEESTRAGLENRFKGRLFSCLLERDYAAVTALHTGEWMNRLTSDTVVAADGLTQIVPGVLGMAVKLIGALAALLWLEPRFLLLLIPGGALLLLFTWLFRRVLKRLHRNIQEEDGRLRVFLQERLGSLLIVKTFAREAASETEAAQHMDAHRTARMKRNRFSNLCNIGFGASMDGVYVLGAGFCGYGILTGTMSYGNFMAVLQLVGQLQSPFANLTGFVPKYYAMLASAERLMEAETFPAEQAPSETDSDFLALGLRELRFSYPGSDSPALDRTNAEIPRGAYVAFTGPSGCGKSTALKLLLGLYRQETGTVYLRTASGEIPLTAAHRNLFAYVPQGNQLLYGTVREIIAFGDREKMIQEDKLRIALQIACAETFVDGLEKGLDTQLGERGAGLSEGQMQRLAIARAIFSDRPVLLLDEATSALDEETEKHLLENLRSMTDKTVAIVTHRSAALDICDTVIRFQR